ncbi:hypothetical protein ACJMK2_007162 [Sinanodonta woodiana]|uniref:Uncharacterized protein n=1 Tax=Sinanodonta woodiana TaxID=1069815 RepID=A0ABD3VIR9_SINWO
MKRHLPGENTEHQAKRTARFKSLQKETREEEDEILPVISKPKPRRRTLRSRKDVLIDQAATSSVDVRLLEKFEEEDKVYASNEEHKTYSRKDSGDTCEQLTALNVIDDQDREIYSVTGKVETSESTTKRKNKNSKPKDSFDIEHKKRRQWTSRQNEIKQIENDAFFNSASLNIISQNSSKKEIDVNKEDAHYKTAEKLDTLVGEINKDCTIVIQNQSDLTESKSFIGSEKVSTTNYSDIDVDAKYKISETGLYNQTDSFNKLNNLAFTAFEHSSDYLRENSAEFVRSEKIVEKSSEHSEADENLLNNAEIIAQSGKTTRLETSTGKNKAFYQNGVENGKGNNNIELDLNIVVEEGHRTSKNENLSPDSHKEVSVNNQIGIIYKEHVNSVAENRKPQNQEITQGDSDDIHVIVSIEAHEKNTIIKCTAGASTHFSSNCIPEISDEDRLAAKLAQELVQTYGGQDITPLEMLANQTVNQQGLSFQTLNTMSSSYETGACQQYQTDNRDQENITSLYPSSNQYSQQASQYGQTEGQQGGQTNISQICDQPHLQYNLQDNRVTFDQQNCNSAPGLYQSSLGIVDGQYSEPYQSNISTPGDQWSNNQQQQPYRYQTADEIQQQLQQTYSLFGDMNGSDGHQSPQPFSTANFIPRPIRPMQMPDQNFGRTFFPSRGSCETSGNYYNHPSRYSNSPYNRTSTAHENYMAAQTISQMDYSTIYPSRDFIEKNAAGCFMSPPQIKQSSSSIDIHKRPSRISRRLQMGMPDSPLMGSPTLSDGLGDFTPLDHRASRSTERFGKQRYIVVNPSSIQHMHPKVLVGKYIDFLIMENEQLTEISKSLSVPKDIYVTEDMYFMDSLKSRNNFPSKKLIDWVCDFYPKLDVLSMQFKGMHPSGIPHPCYSADNGIDCRPTQQILEDTFYFFQREKMNRTNRH